MSRAGKRIAGIIMSFCIAAAMTVPAFAGVWRIGTGGWWYDFEDGTYASDGWYWIDTYGSGIEKCYYFGSNGYLWTDAMTPDGYFVNENGEWYQNGEVMTQEVGYTYDPSSRTYAWLNGVYKAEDGRTVTLDAAGGGQMSVAFYCYSEDGWNTTYTSGMVDEDTRSAIIYYLDGLGNQAGYYQVFLDWEAEQVYVRTYDMNGNDVGSWYDGLYYR